MFRLIPNNDKLQCWRTRNCSEQMSSILNPDDSDIEEDFDVKTCCTCDSGQITVKKSHSKIRWGKLTSSRYHTKCVNNNAKKKPNKKAKMKRNVATKICEPENTIEKLPKFINECYCVYPPKKPLLPGKLSLVDLTENRPCKSIRNLDMLKKAKPLLEYCPETEFLQKMRKEVEEYYTCNCSTCRIKSFIDQLKYTKKRTDLEKAYKQIDSSIFDYGDSDLVLSGRQKHNTDDKMVEILKDPQKIKNLRDFRDTNYFETHSAKDVVAPCERATHKCLHKFTVDERLLPKPVNADAYGNSRCTYCSKIRQENKIKESPRNSAKSGSKPHTIRAPTYDINDEFLSEYTDKPLNNQTDDNLEYLMAPRNGRTVFRHSKNNHDLRIQICQLTNDSPTIASPKKPRHLPRRISNTRIVAADESAIIPKNGHRRTPLTVYNAFSPRKITIGGNADVIELEITPSLLTANNQPIKIQKNRIPRDTFALRYQKGVV